MKKISLNDVRIALKRDELRDIFGGSGYTSSSLSGGCGNGPYGGGSCQSTCTSDSSCSSMSGCSSANDFRRCATFTCATPVSGVYNTSYKRCTC